MTNVHRDRRSLRLHLDTGSVVSALKMRRTRSSIRATIHAPASPVLCNSSKHQIHFVRFAGVELAGLWLETSKVRLWLHKLDWEIHSLFYVRGEVYHAIIAGQLAWMIRLSYWLDSIPLTQIWSDTFHSPYVISRKPWKETIQLLNRELSP